MIQQNNTIESKPFYPTVKKVVVNPNMSLDIFFNESILLPLNVELKFREPQQEECIKEETKYPYEFAEWMKEKNIYLYKDGKFYSCGWVILKDEQVEKFYDDFINRPQKTEWSKEELEKNLNESLKMIAEQRRFIHSLPSKIETVKENLANFEFATTNLRLEQLKDQINYYLLENGTK